MEFGFRALQAFSGWRAASGFPRSLDATAHHSPSVVRSMDCLTHFRVGEDPSDEASAIGSVSLSLADLLAGPVRDRKFPHARL